MAVLSIYIYIYIIGSREIWSLVESKTFSFLKLYFIRLNIGYDLKRLLFQNEEFVQNGKIKEINFFPR